jgi:hypothetical protein
LASGFLFAKTLGFRAEKVTESREIKKRYPFRVKKCFGLKMAGFLTWKVNGVELL